MKKRIPRKKKPITSQWPAPVKSEYRVAVWDCPHCDKEIDSKVWQRNALMLVTEPVKGKSGSCVVVSECPDCGGKSWQHLVDLRSSDPKYYSYEPYPLEWRKALAALHLKRTRETVMRVGGSLCVRCKHLKAIGDSDNQDFRTCKVGMGPTVDPHRHCDSFEMIHEYRHS